MVETLSGCSLSVIFNCCFHHVLQQFIQPYTHSIAFDWFAKEHMVFISNISRDETHILMQIRTM